ncbi:MAG: GNAT family N-acetyltransferase [Lachnospiraceae bacterium]|nr:GNAT family N-acetyltransferase [Lachnospiraceae bacterium]
MQKLYHTDRLLLASLDPSAAPLVLDYLIRNKDDFSKYEPAKEESFYTVPRQEMVLDAEQQLFERKLGARYYIFLNNDPDKVIGNVSFAHTEGPVCMIGYRIDLNYRRRGIAYEATSLLLPKVLDREGPDMLEADIYPNNIASVNLALKLGFRESGTSSFRGRDLIRYTLFNAFKHSSDQS